MAKAKTKPTTVSVEDDLSPKAAPEQRADGKAWMALLQKVALGAIVAFGAAVMPLAPGQPLPPPNLGEADPAGPRGPRGIFGDLGSYLTVEGVRINGTFTGNTTLLVDTVGGRKLPKPVSIRVDNLELPAMRRCVLKGYESGRMIGIPPAARAAAREQGRELIEVQAAWQWQPYFIALIAVEPAGLEIERQRQ